MNDVPLSLVPSVKYLGIQISRDLSWSTHVTSLCVRARKLIGLMYRRFYKYTSTQTLLQLYKALIRPHLEYCSIVWDPLFIKDKEALEKVQRFGLRMCLKDWSLDQNQLLQLSKVASLSERRSQARLYHLFKIVNDLTDFPDAPLEGRELHHNSRQSNTYQLKTIRGRTSYFQNSFFPSTIAHWNSLPADISSSSTLPTFKRNVSSLYT